MLHCENLITTLDRFNTAIYLKDPHGRYLSMNTNGINLMNGNKARVLGKTAYDLFDYSAAAQMEEIDQHSMRMKGVHTGTYEATDKESAKLLPMFTAKTSVRSPLGEPLGVLGISIVGYNNDVELFSEAVRMLPKFVQIKQARILNELLELRTVTEFLKLHHLH